MSRRSCWKSARARARDNRSLPNRVRTVARVPFTAVPMSTTRVPSRLAHSSHRSDASLMSARATRPPMPWPMSRTGAVEASRRDRTSCFSTAADSRMGRRQSVGQLNHVVVRGKRLDQGVVESTNDPGCGDPLCVDGQAVQAATTECPLVGPHGLSLGLQLAGHEVGHQESGWGGLRRRTHPSRIRRCRGGLRRRP